MLESMQQNPRPTRAEANDVANAIFDGTDCVMLSGETAGGKYPVEAVSLMARIAENSEGNIDYEKLQKTSLLRKYLAKNVTNAISHAAMRIADEMGAACIAAITDSGFAARMVSRARPSQPILAITTDPVVYRQMNMTWGCRPFLHNRPFEGDSEVFDIAEDVALSTGLAENGQCIIALAGVPIGKAGATNTIRVRTVGDVLATGKGNDRGVICGLTRVFTPENTDESIFFEQGDIIICTQTDDGMMEYIKKCGALVIGSWEKLDFSHAETVAKALDIPMLHTQVRPVDFISSGMPVTVDTHQGLLLNGFKK
jgi:pyruvate kinase